jgi:protein SCO1/2
VLITLFYGSCPAACPLLIDTVRATERAVPATLRSRLRVLLISIDPEHDTVANLQALVRRTLRSWKYWDGEQSNPW